MTKDKIYCSGCKKDIDIYEDILVHKNLNWDVYCTICNTWLGGMQELLGWSL